MAVENGLWEGLSKADSAGRGAARPTAFRHPMADRRAGHGVVSRAPTTYRSNETSRALTTHRSNETSRAPTTLRPTENAPRAGAAPTTLVVGLLLSQHLLDRLGDDLR